MRYLLLPFLLSLTFIVQGQTPDTAAVRVEIDSLIKLNKSLVKERKFDEGLQVIQQAEEKCLATFGEEIALYATILSKIGIAHYYKREVSKVEPYFLKAKNIREKVLGKEHPDYASSLNSLGILYMAMRQYEKAEPFYLESKTIKEKVLGKEHPNYALSLNHLGSLYGYMGQYEKAEPFYLEAIAINEKVLGNEHPDYAASLYNLGTLYMIMEQYEKAEPFFLEAIAIEEKVLGKEHPDHASSLSNLGLLYNNMGQYEKAELFYLEAIAIKEKVFGKEHSDYASSLSKLGTLYRNMGQYEKAEPLFLEAIAINEKVLGKEHPDYTTILNNLGALYVAIGQYEKAEPLYLETKDNWEKVFGKEHPDYALILANLGVLYEAMEQYEKAEPLYLEAIAINEKVLGKEHRDYAKTLSNMGLLYMAMGQNEKAETFYLEAHDIWQKALGKEHPQYALSLYRLGLLYSEIDQNEKAETFYLEAHIIWQKTLGKEHPHFASSLNNQGNLYMAMGQNEKAEPLFLEANEIRKLLLLKASRYLSERELLTYTNTFISDQNQLLSFAKRQEEVAGSVYDNSLFYKGFILNATQQLSRMAQTDSLSADMFLQLKGYNRRLAKAYSQPLTERDSSIIADLEEKANIIEKELTRSVAGFGEALRQVHWQEVQASLKPNEAAIEFVHYQYSDPDPTDSTMYAALVLRPGDEQPTFIPLFEQKQIKQVLSGKDQSENIALAYGSRGLTPKKTKDLQGLYSLIWQPLEEQLKGVKKVYYSPSGLMHRINFAAIPINQSKSLSDKYQLTRLASTRSLVIADLTKPNSKNEAVLFGGIEYEMQGALVSRGELTEEKTSTRSSELSFSYTDRSTPQRGDNWKYLAGTKSEVENIDRLLNQSNFEVTTFSELQATEESFKALGADKASPLILHLATHGFFFPDPKTDKASTSLSSDPVFKISDHPMIRSGLILAGGNHAWKTGKSMYPDMEDGILTAYEISQMDLSSTELVVLSACETGLGDIEGNEGVYGLQRAFKIAGAKYLIMSLWQVPDHQTQELMTLFYSKCLPAGQAGLEGKMAIPEAFRAAQKEMRQKYDDPYFWAGFVLVE